MTSYEINNGIGLFPCIKLDDFESYTGSSDVSKSWGLYQCIYETMVLREDYSMNGKNSVFVDISDGSNTIGYLTSSCKNNDEGYIDAADFNALHYNIQNDHDGYDHIVNFYNNSVLTATSTGSVEYGDFVARELMPMTGSFPQLTGFWIAVYEGAHSACNVKVDDVYLLVYDEDYIFQSYDMGYSDSMVFNTIKIPGRYGGIPVIGGQSGRTGNAKLFVPESRFEETIRFLQYYRGSGLELLLVTRNNSFAIFLEKIDVKSEGGKDRKLIEVSISFVESCTLGTLDG